MSEMNTNSKSAAAAYLLWFFLGAFGAHRFYMGRNGSAFGQLGLFIGSVLLSVVAIGLIGFPILGIWLLVDVFLINGWLKEANNAVISTVSASVEETSQAA